MNKLQIKQPDNISGLDGDDTYNIQNLSRKWYIVTDNKDND